MFGFPFITSLIITMAMVIVFSYAINRGKTGKKDSSEQTANQGHTDNNNHAKA